MSNVIGLKSKVALAALFAATFAYGGFWDVVNKVQRTVETVTAVGGEIVNGQAIPSTVKIRSDKKTKGL